MNAVSKDADRPRHILPDEVGDTVETIRHDVRDLSAHRIDCNPIPGREPDFDKRWLGDRCTDAAYQHTLRGEDIRQRSNQRFSNVAGGDMTVGDIASTGGLSMSGTISVEAGRTLTVNDSDMGDLGSLTELGEFD